MSWTVIVFVFTFISPVCSFVSVKQKSNCSMEDPGIFGKVLDRSSRILLCLLGIWLDGLRTTKSRFLADLDGSVTVKVRNRCLILTHHDSEH
ncbi:hypothetical protein EDC04DRAFT_2082686 [Pisolithus marmoratus]|nr:hypothetical protein EDC04DRAFT_2082686 [Pisolithus marmoratus]